MTDGLYTFYGMSQPDVNFELKANSVRTTAKGERCLRFKNGSQIAITFPVYYMRGLPLLCVLPRADIVSISIQVEADDSQPHLTSLL